MYKVIFFNKYIYNDKGSVKFFLLNNSKLVITGLFGYSIMLLIDYGFIKFSNNTNLKFLFLNKVIYSNFIKYFFRMYFFVLNLFFFKVKLKGLGYRLKKIAPRIIKFFFAKNHFFYLHIPYSFYFKRKRKNLFVFAYNKMLLNDLYHHLMLLKKIDLYEKTNTFVTKHKILFLKKRK